MSSSGDKDPMGDRLVAVSNLIEAYRQVAGDFEGNSSLASLTKEVRAGARAVALILKKQQEILVLLEHEIEELKKGRRG